MRLILILLLLVYSSYAQVKVNKEEVMKKLEELKEKGILSEEVLKRVEEYRKRIKPLIDSVQKEDPVVPEAVTAADKRLYIFMSSSVPREIWYAYARQVASRRLNAVFLLRGCIGGCKYIKPTLSFIKDIITLGGEEKGGLPVEVWIDPIKFREYGVSAVPCFAYEGKKRLSCGDWSLEYHLRKLND